VYVRGSWGSLLQLARSRLRLEAKLLPGEDWTSMGEFKWWAPRPGAELAAYIVHRNVPTDEYPVDQPSFRHDGRATEANRSSTLRSAPMQTT
jgi:hypothetical protein